ncbi:hypothetical protein PENSUB_7979 [Penicillium subrubescens]|uniref:Uncharacterized protein n=1 Tax=Penicillium subrubescens TaxID=1316194 RepID=A0A1Q5TJ09_9EURO|nr:hypothetical protein PENSUB_7979 [Penicillium subrubescens]
MTKQANKSERRVFITNNHQDLKRYPPDSHRFLPPTRPPRVSRQAPTQSNLVKSVTTSAYTTTEKELIK